MQFFIRQLSRAFAAFRSQSYHQGLSELQRAVLEFKAKEGLNKIFLSAIYDALGAVEFFVNQATIIESNSYLKDKLESLKKALDQLYLSGGAGEEEQLTKAMQDFAFLLEGMKAITNYSEFEALDPFDKKPLISLELTEDGKILLYGWKGEGKERNIAIEELRASFESFFAIEKLEELDYIDQAKKEKDLGNYEKSLESLNLALQQQPKRKRDCFLLIGELYFVQQQYPEAIDYYMKALVFGLPKTRIEKNVRFACRELMKDEDHPKKRKRWQELIVNFFPHKD